jgi:hypothetical protein
MSSFTLAQFNREQWLAQKLGITDLYGGTTTADERRERIRQTIIERGLAGAECFKKNGVAQDFRAAFCGTYGVQLDTDELNFAGDMGVR